MPVLADLYDYIDPELDEYSDPYAHGESVRANVGVDEEVGRLAIQKIQPELEGPSVGEFLGNLGRDVGDFAHGTWEMAVAAVRNRDKIGEVAAHPIATAEAIGSAVAQDYKQRYTPQEGESVPGMMLRNLYEKPFTTLMDASAVGQMAFGGAGLAVKAASSGARAAVAGGKIGESLIKMASGTLAEADAEALQVARRAASAERGIDTMARATERAKQIDPINLALGSAKALYRRARPDAVAALEATKGMTDARAERTAILRAAKDEAQAKTEAAFSELNEAERLVIHPYVAGRVNFDRPVGEQLLSHTGEWVPIKGDVIRPDVLEKARQAYIPIQQELLYKWGQTPEQVQLTATANAMNGAKQFLGDQFDPLHPQVQEYVLDHVSSALQKNQEVLMSRATGEVRTSLDIAKEKAWRAELEGMIDQNLYSDMQEAEKAMPRPNQTTVQEALDAMGPQGGMYWPHSAEAVHHDQSTIRNILSTLGEAAPWKDNEYTLYRNGVLENQDPVKALMRAYSTFDEAKTWIQMGYEEAEKLVAAGRATRMPRDWKWTADHDVAINRTHQPFHPGMMMTDELTEEAGQRLLTRLLEVIDEAAPAAASGIAGEAGLPAGISVGNLNFADLMRKMAEQAEKGPIYRYKKELPLYKVENAFGHAVKDLRDSLQPPTNPLARTIDGITQWWNYTNLNLRATRLLNNIVGNTAFAVMQGVHPFTPRGLSSLIAMGRAMGAKAGVLADAESLRLAKVFDLPGVRSGGLQSEISAVTGRTGERLLESRNPLARLVGWGGENLARWNQNIESAYRGASLFYELSDNAIGKAKRMLGHADNTMSLGEKIEGFQKMGAPVSMKMPEYRSAIKSVNRFFNDYDRTSPFERTTLRRIFPYYKFFKHSTDLITKYPFEHPIKGQLARVIGAAALRDTKETLEQYGMSWDRDVAPHQQDSIPVMRENDPVTGKPVIWLASTKGANPFSQLSGYLAEQYLQMLNPVVKVAIEQSTGINLFTRERYRGALSSFTGREVDKKTGQIVDSFTHPSMPEAFLRSFWPYTAARELVAQGRVPTDTASLLAMVTNSPEAWQKDERGFARRQPIRSPYQALLRGVGPIPQPLTQPTPKQRASRRGTVNTQLNTLLQRYPNRRKEILAAIQESGQEVRRRGRR